MNEFGSDLTILRACDKSQPESSELAPNCEESIYLLHKAVDEIF
jgi:hypothetical protein